MSTGGTDGGPSLEEQVVMLQQQLEQAQKLTALGELVSTTTHEFNNVLTTIINYARMGLRHQDQATRDGILPGRPIGHRCLIAPAQPQL